MLMEVPMCINSEWLKREQRSESDEKVEIKERNNKGTLNKGTKDSDRCLHSSDQKGCKSFVKAQNSKNLFTRAFFFIFSFHLSDFFICILCTFFSITLFSFATP